MVVPLKIQTGSDGTIAVLFSSMKDQRNNLRGCDTGCGAVSAVDP